MNENDFFSQQQAAVERMREMNSRAVRPQSGGQQMPPVPPFVRVPGENYKQNQRQNTQNSNNQQRNTPPPKRNSPPPKPSQKPERENNQQSSLFGGLNLPFLDMIKNDSDVSLIIGLILILLSEKADKKLLFALIYILM